MMDLCLVATSGDCGPRGMSSIADVIPISHEEFPIVKGYLKAEFNDRLVRMEHPYEYDKWKRQTKIATNWRMKMLDKGIFQDKYDLRTDWDIAYLDEVKEGCLGNIEKFNIVDRGN